MSKVLATIKAVITRLVFACHGIIAIWQVTIFKGDNTYWYLASPTLLLFIEGVFTLTIKDNQEWKWFCPSVFVYLGNVVPAVWLLELHKVEKRLQARAGHLNVSISGVDLDSLSKMIGTKIQIPDIPLTTETWVTLIEQFLMLTLIVGRWLLPKGDLTRDQLSQLLLVYIGTAADIIEFFDSFKDDKIASEPLLVLLTLAIWSWSLMQFTVVLTATKSRKSRATANGSCSESGSAGSCCCSIDVCAIVMNIALQDAPFLAFRLLIITHYRIVSYMNVFFTCKNTLVILLQMYRLYVVHSEMNKDKRSKAKEKYRRKDKKHNTEGRRHHGKEKRGRDVVEYGTPNVAVITDPRKMYDGESSKIRAFILTNREDLQEIELSKLFRDQATLERISEDTRKKKGKSGGKKTKHEERDSESSPTSTPNINHTTDDSGI